MTFRTTSKHTASRNRRQLAVEAEQAATDLEAAIAESLKTGMFPEGSREHLEAKRELTKLRDAISRSRRRSP